MRFDGFDVQSRTFVWIWTKYTSLD